LTEIAGPSGPLDVLISGSGAPITIFAHGFAGSIAETRPFGSGIDGTKVFFHFGGHGTSRAPDGPWSYELLAAELSCVRREYGARRGVGVSMGAGALLAATIAEPGSFERLVLILPATVDSPRTGRAVERVEAMARCADQGDVAELTALLVAEQPEHVRAGRIVQAWARAQAERMTGTALTGVMREVPQLFPVAGQPGLAAITCPVLVLGQEGDEAHPAGFVRELVDAIPDSRGLVFEPGGLLWGDRTELRAEIRGFLNQH
jgi:pimeloyl-ACP methyl ester carboxylesterase